MRLRWLRRCLWLAGGVLALGIVLMMWGGWQIASPSRRAIQDYHEVILGNPAAHGMTIESFDSSEGTPVVVCRPGGVLGERGRLIREQLSERGWGSQVAEQGAENGMTLVLLHGRHGRKEDMLPIAERFCAAGFRCVLLDLPGHGEHPDAVATFGVREAGLPKGVLDEVAERFGFDHQPAGLWGISMGGSVAMHAAARDPDAWTALVVVASFDALEPVIERQCDEWVGRWLGRLIYTGASAVYEWRSGVALADIRPVDGLNRVTAGTMIVHGDDDPLIPPAAGEALYGALTCTSKSQIHVAAGTHGNVLVTPQPLYVEMMMWMLANGGWKWPSL